MSDNSSDVLCDVPEWALTHKPAELQLRSWLSVSLSSARMQTANTTTAATQALPSIACLTAA